MVRESFLEREDAEVEELKYWKVMISISSDEVFALIKSFH